MGHFFQMVVTPRIPNGMMLIPLPKYVVGWFTTFWNTPSTDKVWKALRITDDFFWEENFEGTAATSGEACIQQTMGWCSKKDAISSQN